MSTTAQPIQSVITDSPVPLPTGVETDPTGVSAGSMQTHLEESNAAYVDWENRMHQAEYDNAVAYYNANVASGSLGLNPVPPNPPLALVYLPASQSPSGLPSWTYGAPLAPTPPLTVSTSGVAHTPVNDPTAPRVCSIGPPIPDNPGWFFVGPMDNEPAGFRKTFPGPDGSPITVTKWKDPWGQKYEQTAGTIVSA
jgi:hypothetical protein